VQPTIQSLVVGFPLRVVAFPAPDVPDAWLVHSLDLDIMAQGSSPAHALDTLRGALIEMIAFRLSRGLPPLEWNQAPEEFWTVAERTLGTKLDRSPPTQIEFATSRDSLSDYPSPMAVTDRAPDLIAHAG
jgi:hypothetical protein